MFHPSLSCQYHGIVAEGHEENVALKRERNFHHIGPMRFGEGGGTRRSTPPLASVMTSRLAMRSRW